MVKSSTNVDFQILLANHIIENSCTAKEAGDVFGISKQTVNKSIRKLKDSNYQLWERVNNIRPLITLKSQEKGGRKGGLHKPNEVQKYNMKGKRARKVIQYDSITKDKIGTYDSVKDAAYDNYLGVSALYKAIKNKCVIGDSYFEYEQ